MLWSWHLWFTADDVLETTTVTNPGGHSYKVTNETLGWKYTFWSGSTYHEPRSVQVKVEQEIKNGAPAVRKYAVFTLMQNDGVIRRGYATLYQFGRKDALPGTDKVTISYAEGLQTLGTVIQHPRTMYHKQYFPYDHFNVRYFNLWSAESTTDVYNDNVVYKTVYDPSPVGFKVPAPNLFTAFSTNGAIGGPMNIARPWNYGHTFYNKVTNPDATLYFPATGSLFYTNGVLREVGVAAT